MRFDLVTMVSGWRARCQDLDQRPGDAVLSLDRLIGIGVGAEGDRRRLVLGRRKLPLEQLGRALFGEQAGLEIEPGGETHVGVGGPGVAIEAAVLAAAVGIDRAVEGDVGRLVAGDDRLGLLPGDLGRERLGRLVAGPAVVERLALFEFETAGGVGRRAASAPEFGGQNAFGDRLGSVTRVRGGGLDRGHGDGPERGNKS